MKFSPRFWVGGLAGLTLLAGCGGPDFHVRVGDAKGLEKGAPIIWRGTEVGTVAKVTPVASGVRIDATLQPAARGQLRADVRAAVESGALTGGKTILRLYGGTDPAATQLKRGQEISEATVVDRSGLRTILNSRQMFLAAIVGLGALLALVFSKGLLRLVVGVATIAAVAAVGWILWRDWERGGGTVLPTPLVKQINDIANQTFRSAEAIAAWKIIEADLEDLANKAREGSATGLQKSRDAATRLLDEQIARLRAQGKEAAAQDLETVKQNLDGVLKP